MPHYKLIYFNGTGLGELIRYLFAYGKIEYEDFRVPVDETFKSFKQGLPFGRLPILEIDGKVVAQSMAISRYLAIPLGLYGKDVWENLLIDEAVGHIDDFRLNITFAYWEADPEGKVKKMNHVKTEHIPYFLKRFEELVAQNDGYFVLGRVTLAELHFHSLLNYFNFTTQIDVLDGYPNLQKLADRVAALPGIKEWLANRPAGMF